MRFKWTKVIVVCAFVVIIVTLASIQVFARDFYMAGHYDPTGTTTTTYAYPSSECDRKINVSYYDTSGNFLKKVVIHTKKGMEASFHIGLGGYDITKFESNQGLWETCKMSWTSGTGTCTEDSGYGYEGCRRNGWPSGAGCHAGYRNSGYCNRGNAWDSPDDRGNPCRK